MQKYPASTKDMKGQDIRQAHRARQHCHSSGTVEWLLAVLAGTGHTGGCSSLLAITVPNLHAKHLKNKE